MPVPKRRMSRSRTRHRRAQWSAHAPTLVNVSIRGRSLRIPRRLLKAAHLGHIDPETLT